MLATALSALSNVELARLVLRQLWQDQDASGISGRRDPRNCLLEDAMALIPLRRDVDSESFEELKIEAERRAKLIGAQGILCECEFEIQPIQDLSSLALAILLLAQLSRHYQAELMRKPDQGFGRELRIFAVALQLLPPLPSADFKIYSSEELLEEVSRREYLAAVKRFQSVG